MTLYELNSSIQELEDILNGKIENMKEVDGVFIDTTTGEVFDVLKLIDNVSLDRKNKIENLGVLIKNLNAEIDARKNEKKHQELKIKQCETKLNWFNNYLTNCLLQKNEMHFKTPKVTLSFRKSECVEIENEELLPKKYQQIIETIKIDKMAIKEDIKSGKKVNGAFLVEKQNLQIK